MTMPPPRGRFPGFKHKSDEDFLASRNPPGVTDDDLQNHEAWANAETDEDLELGEPGSVTDGHGNAEADPE